MRNLFCFLLIVAEFVPGAHPQTQPPFSIAISTEKSEVKAVGDLYIKVQMKNISDHEVDCTRNPTNGWDEACQFDVRDISGSPLEPKILVPGHPEIKGITHIWPCLLKPGEATNDDNIINRGFDMSRPGKYRVQVSRFIDPRDKEHGVVKSNSLTITVTP